MKIVITGVGGQIGTDLLVALTTSAGADAHSFVLLDNRSASALTGTDVLDRKVPNWRNWFRELDVTDREAVRRLVAEEKPNLVYHLAAILSGNGERDPALCWRVNVEGLHNVLAALAESSDGGQRRPRLVWPSSIAAFGPAPGMSGLRYTSSDTGPFHPISMYGVTKVVGEQMGNYFAHKLHVDFRSVRFPGILSAVEPGGGSSDYANELYAGAVRNGRCGQCFVAEDVALPFMHISDALAALVRLAEVEEQRMTRRIYNVGALALNPAQMVESIRKLVPGYSADYSSAQLDDYAARRANVMSWPEDVDDSAARTDWDWKPTVADPDELSKRLIDEYRDRLVQ